MCCRGNKQYEEGDKIKRPQQEGGGGREVNQAADDGEGEDAFQFALSQEEFLDIFLRRSGTAGSAAQADEIH